MFKTYLLTRTSYPNFGVAAPLLPQRSVNKPGEAFSGAIDLCTLCMGWSGWPLPSSVPPRLQRLLRGYPSLQVDRYLWRGTGHRAAYTPAGQRVDGLSCGAVFYTYGGVARLAGCCATRTPAYVRFTDKPFIGALSV